MMNPKKAKKLFPEERKYAWLVWWSKLSIVNTTPAFTEIMKTPMIIFYSMRRNVHASRDQVPFFIFLFATIDLNRPHLISQFIRKSYVFRTPDLRASFLFHNLLYDQRYTIGNI